jgi:hypothetical protein
MSRLRIAASAAGVIAVLIVGVVVLGETAAPWGDQQAQAMQLRLKAGNLGMATNSGLWARDGNNIINAKAALAHLVDGHPDVELADVRVFGFNDANELVSFRNAKLATRSARRGRCTTCATRAFPPKARSAPRMRNSRGRPRSIPRSWKHRLLSSIRNTCRCATSRATSVTCAPTGRTRAST